MASRESYLRFLSRKGKSEADVLSLLTKHERAKLEIVEQILDAVAESDDPKYQEVLHSSGASLIKQQSDLKWANTNFLLYSLYQKLCDGFVQLNIPLFP